MTFRIGLDVDGVLYNWEAQARRILKEDFAIDLPISTSWDYIKDSIPEKYWKWLWSDALRDLFYYGNPYPKISDGVSSLAKYGKIVIITNIPREVSNFRLQWLLDHYIQIDEYRIPNGITEKSKVLPLCNIYIDDSPHVAEDILKNTNSILFLWDRPWNQNVAGTYYRINSWDQIIEKFDSWTRSESEILIKLQNEN